MPDLTVTFQDSMGRQTRAIYEIASTDPATAYAAAVLVTDNAAEVSKMEVVKAQLALPVSFNPNAVDPTANTDVDGKVKGVSDDDGKTVTLRVPDPLAAIVRADGTLDLAQLNMAAFLAHFETGGDAELSDGEQVASWRFGVLDKR